LLVAFHPSIYFGRETALRNVETGAHTPLRIGRDTRIWSNALRGHVAEPGWRKLQDQYIQRVVS
jgi:hypothetical protein